MLDTEEEDGYLIALWPLSSSKQRANASIVSVRCPLTSSAFLPAPAPDACLPADTNQLRKIVSALRRLCSLSRLLDRRGRHYSRQVQGHV